MMSMKIIKLKLKKIPEDGGGEDDDDVIDVDEEDGGESD